MAKAPAYAGLELVMDLDFLWEIDVSELCDEQGKGDPLRKGEEENLTAVALLVRDLDSVG